MSKESPLSILRFLNGVKNYNYHPKPVSETQELLFIRWNSTTAAETVLGKAQRVPNWRNPWRFRLSFLTTYSLQHLINWSWGINIFAVNILNRSADSQTYQYALISIIRLRWLWYVLSLFLKEYKIHFITRRRYFFYSQQNSSLLFEQLSFFDLKLDDICRERHTRKLVYVLLNTFCRGMRKYSAAIFQYSLFELETMVNYDKSLMISSVLFCTF